MIVPSWNLFIKSPNISVLCKAIVSKNAEKEHFMKAFWEDAPASPNVGHRTDYRDNSLIYLASHCFTRASSDLQTWHWGYVNISSPVWRMHLSRTELPWICPVVVCKIDGIRSGSWKVFRAALKKTTTPFVRGSLYFMEPFILQES